MIFFCISLIFFIIGMPQFLIVCLKLLACVYVEISGNVWLKANVMMGCFFFRIFSQTIWHHFFSKWNIYF